MDAVPAGLRRLSCVQVILFLLLGLAAANAQQPGSASTASGKDQTFRIGGESIAIPAPSGDLPEIGSDYRVVLEPLAPDTNRLVAAFVPPDYVKEIKTGHPPRLTHYALAEVARRAEFVDLDPAEFKQITETMSQKFGGDVADSLKGQEEEFNRRLKDLNSNAATITFDKPVPLGTLFSKPDAWAYGMIMPISAKGVTATMVMGVTILRVQDRLLFVYLYQEYKDTSTAQWLRAACEKWADAILAANSKTD